MGSLVGDDQAGGQRDVTTPCVPLAPALLPTGTHQAEGVSPGQGGGGPSPTTQHSLRGVSPGDRGEDLSGRQAVCPLVEEENLHHLRRLPGSGETRPGDGREQPVYHQEAEEKDRTRKKKKDVSIE